MATQHWVFQWGRLILHVAGSPGSRDSRRPRHPPEPSDDEELFVVKGSKNSTSGDCRQMRKSAKYKGLKGKTVQIST